jgi:ribonuclease HII
MHKDDSNPKRDLSERVSKLRTLLSPAPIKPPEKEPEPEEEEWEETVPNTLVAGMDEVGTGALAGPACIAVVVFPRHYPRIKGVNDSKQVSKEHREELAPLITQQATWVGVGWASSDTIDACGIWGAWQIAAREALEGMPEVSELWIDGNRKVEGWPGKQFTLVKGDANPMYWWIGAASIVAKVARDLTMRQLAASYTGYGWKRNVGYGTKEHWEGLRKHGATTQHRKLFLRKQAKKMGLKL